MSAPDPKFAEWCERKRAEVLLEGMATEYFQCPHGEPVAKGCRDCDREHREATA